MGWDYLAFPQVPPPTCIKKKEGKHEYNIILEWWYSKSLVHFISIKREVKGGSGPSAFKHMLIDDFCGVWEVHGVGWD